MICSAPNCGNPATHHVHVHCPFMDDPLGAEIACFPLAHPYCEFHAGGHTVASAMSPLVRLDLLLICQRQTGRIPDFIRAEVDVLPLDDVALAMIEEFERRNAPQPRPGERTH